MNRIVLVIAATVLAGFTATAVPAPAPESKQVHAQGCVQAGIENRCLVLNDLRTGKLYNLMVKEPQPMVGEGIEFTGVPYDGVTMCMQGIPVRVTQWKHKDSLRCPQGEAQKK
jgi:hypothetical protein